ncbi:MAG: leucine-rich repeat protein [Clostridia bacterium]|nr:leucine-rich repeat protein [Clostridia bacterium]
MKKRVFILALLAWSMTSIFALSACGGGSTDSSSSGSSSNVNSSDTTSSSTASSDGTTSDTTSDTASSSDTTSDTASSSDTTSDATSDTTSSDTTSDTTSSDNTSSDGTSQVEYTAVTYVFVNDAGETLSYDQTLEVGETLSYSLENIEYTDTWYADSACTQVVAVAAGETMTVYTSFNDIYIDYVIRSNGSTVEIDSVALRNGAIVLPQPQAVEGHSFQGWVLGETTYNVGDEISFAVAPENNFVEITASWTANNFSVRYVSAGSETKEVSQAYGDAVQAPESRTGYTFLGWYEAGSDVPVTVITKEVELMAKWEAFSYALTFSLGGCEGDYHLVDGNYDYGTQVGLPQLNRKGYQFLGWFVSVDGAEAVKMTEYEYTVGSDLNAETVALEAKFAPKERTVTVYLEKGATEQVTLKTGDNLSNALQDLVGERFSGWFYDAENLKGVGVNDVLPAIDDNETFCVYGAYDKMYTIKFVSNGTSYEKVLLFGAVIQDVATKEGHDFLGWFTKETGGDKITHVPAGDQTLYAQFELKTVQANFNLNGGSGELSDKEQKYGDTISLPNGEGISKKYYNFGGWTDGTTTYEAGAEVTLLDNVTFTAIWNSYDVTLHLTDWDGTVILSGEFASGSALELPENSVWTTIDEFDGFDYEDIYGNEYTLKVGDLLGEDVTATAFYVNRRTGEKLVFPSADTFEFYDRNGTAYWISGRTRTWNEERGVYEYAQFFKAKALPKDYFCLPATYNGKPIYGIPDADRMSVGGFSVYAASQFNYDGDAYKVTGHLYIPSCYFELGDYAFYSQQATIVEFGRNSNVRRFGERADILMNATAVYGFPEKLAQVENYAMQNSSNAYKIYTQDGEEITKFPSSIRYLGVDAFRNVDIFTEVDMTNVVSCAGSVFANCTKIEKATLGNLTGVPSGLFYGCTGLKEVVIPACVEVIRTGAFQESGVETVVFEEGSKLHTIEYIAFYKSKLREIDIPEGVTTIASSAFAGTTDIKYDSESVLERVSLPSTLKTIGDFAFAGTLCSEFVLPEGLISVGECAFYGTQNWKKIVLPNSLVTIGEKAFMKLGNYTFAEEDKYVLEIGDNLEFIDQAAFRQIKIFAVFNSPIAVN